MVEECLALLEPERGGVFVDATVGAGGHSRAIGEALGDKGTLFGMDLDPNALAIAKETLAGLACEWHLIQGNYTTMKEALKTYGIEEVKGVLFDLGACSLQFDRAEKGFSFRLDGPLDMRFDPTGRVTAGDLVNGLSQQELARLFLELGEERAAGRLARAIVQERGRSPFSTTTQLAEFVARVKGRAGGRIHPATKVFQALRIATNSELTNLESGLEAALEILSPGGRLVAIAYHSGEHRVLKRFLRKNSGVCICPLGVLRCECEAKDLLTVLTKRGIAPSFQEIKDNPRARSARLRAARKRGGEEG
jgi:16S rRNA (cytosine1402-N4)-methyltransferase